MLTIRDSPADHINIVCWGSQEYITKLNSSFKINDVVEICNPNIQTKSSSPVDDRWRPTTSRLVAKHTPFASLFQLNVMNMMLHVTHVCSAMCLVSTSRAPCICNCYQKYLLSVLAHTV